MRRAKKGIKLQSLILNLNYLNWSTEQGLLNRWYKRNKNCIGSIHTPDPKKECEYLAVHDRTSAILSCLYVGTT